MDGKVGDRGQFKITRVLMEYAEGNKEVQTISNCKVCFEEELHTTAKLSKFCVQSQYSFGTSILKQIV